MKYIIVFAEGFSDKIIVVDETIEYDNQNRMFFFKELYPEIKEKEFLSLLKNNDLDFLKQRVFSFLDYNYRKSVTKHVTERHHKVEKIFLDKEYELFVIEDRLAILGIDLYNINIYSKQYNIPIQYKTFETKKEFVRYKI